MTKHRVFLLTDHKLLRDLIRFYLEGKRDDLAIVGTAATANETLTALAQLQADIIVMDLTLPDMDGIEMTGEVLRRWPSIKIIAVTELPEQHYLLPFLQLGGYGYLPKTAADTDLLVAIEHVLQNQIYLSAYGVQVMAGQFKKQVMAEVSEEETAVIDVPPDVLSPREKQVLMMIAHGYSYREIGEKLYITLSTVETYKSRISEKLGISRVANLVAYAIRNDIL